MELKSTDLQKQINEIDQKIQSGVNLSDRNQLEAERSTLNDQLQAALTEEANQQHLQERVEQAKVTGYILDTIEIGGLPAIAFSHTPENHELLAIEVQKLFLAQEDAFNEKVNDLNTRLDISARQLLEEVSLRDAIQQEKEKLERINFTLEQEKKEAEQNRDNAVRITEELQVEVNRQAAKIKELLDRASIPAIEIAPLSAEEQETKLVADLMGNRLKVTNIRFKDESGLDRRKVLANNALTGEEIEEYAIYSKTRWEEIGLESAAQLQVDYANKKAELELQSAIIPVQAESIEYVTEQDEAATEMPFQVSEEIADGQGDSTDVRNEHLEQVVEQDSEVVTRTEFRKRLVDFKNEMLIELESNYGLVRGEVA